jgi:hypothetical protein
VVRGLKCPRHTACVKIPLLAKAARSRAPVNDGPADNQLMVKVRAAALPPPGAGLETTMLAVLAEVISVYGT